MQSLKELEMQLEGCMSIVKNKISATSVGSDDKGSIEYQKLDKSLRVWRDKLASNVEEKLKQTQQEMNEQLDQAIREVSSMFKEKLNVEEAVEGKHYNSFGEKMFTKRDSMLSILLLDPNFQTIYNIFVALLVMLGIHIIVREWFETGRILDMSLWVWCFGRFSDVVIPYWLLVSLLAFLVVPLVQVIVHFKLPFTIWLLPYTCLQLLLYTVACSACSVHSLPPASGFVIMCEAARLSMKTHAYFREKMLHGRSKVKFAEVNPLALLRSKRAGKEEKEEKEEKEKRVRISIGSTEVEIKRFLYFSFVPTLVYRDEYPRTSHVRLGVFFRSILDTFGCILYTFLVFRQFCVSQFRHTALHPGDLQSFVMSIFHSMLPGTLVLLLGFFGILHSWFNAFAEITRYADRRFYEDWWNSHNFHTYYRKWNMVVHEFLFQYVYLDSIRFSYGKVSRFWAMMAVFVISALIHELIIACAMGFFYPILLLMFGGPGVIFVFMSRANSRVYNIWMWTMLFIGNGLLLVLYSREWYARTDIASGKLIGGFWDFPYSWVAFPHMTMTPHQ
eukprot:GILI01015002.1.p1 GENE.GILI01015002.1~~GILI01015002.1.p1  ORF type:complete len:607 (+),score=130.50 GILI01015002.1:145-1821(+)